MIDQPPPALLRWTRRAHLRRTCTLGHLAEPYPQQHARLHMRASECRSSNKGASHHWESHLQARSAISRGARRMPEGLTISTGEHRSGREFGGMQTRGRTNSPTSSFCTDGRPGQSMLSTPREPRETERAYLIAFETGRVVLGARCLPRGGVAGRGCLGHCARASGEDERVGG